MADYTMFLLARPSFWGGFASALDMGGTLMEFNQSMTGAQADAIALRMDWCAIGNDLRKAVREFAVRTELNVPPSYVPQ